MWFFSAQNKIFINMERRGKIYKCKLQSCFFKKKKNLFNAKGNKGLLTRGPARLYLLVNQPYRCPDRTRLPALFQNRFKERVENMAMPKGGFESGAGALGEWRIAQGNKQQCTIVVMGTMLVTHMTKLVTITILVTQHIKVNIFIYYYSISSPLQN